MSHTEHVESDSWNGFERTVNLRFRPPSCTERFKIDSRTNYPKGLTQLGEADIRHPRAAHNAIAI